MKIPYFVLLTMAVVSLATSYGEKPNIILINADDLGWAEIGSYGQKKIKTPNLDSLAAQGQRWTQFYSGAPTCAPSRNVLMTGRHSGCDDVRDLKRADKKETWDDLRGDWPMSAEAYTLPAALKKQGYTTGLFGKWGLGEYGTTGAPDKHGFDRFYGYTDQRMCHTFYPVYLWNDGKKEVINEPVRPGNFPGHYQQPEGEVVADDYRGKNHASELIADQMLQFVDKMAKEKKPFFLYYAPLEPHVAIQPLQKWVDNYPKEWDSEPYRGQNGYLPHPRPRAAYAGMISQMDNYVGRLMETLKRDGLADNTIIIFTSDNGTTHDVGGVDHKFFDSVRGLKGLKGQVYEGGIRVPGIVWWPAKIKGGSVVDQPAYAADVMPTLCAIAGADAGSPRGNDLSPVLFGKEDTLKDRNPMIWAGGAYGGQVAVRIGDMKIVRQSLFPSQKNRKNWEVYNIKTDPEEKNNLAASERELIEKAKAILDKEYIAPKDFDRLQYELPEVTDNKKK